MSSRLDYLNLARYVRTHTASEKALLMFFALVADKEGVSFHSVESIVWFTGLEKRTVNRGKKFLKELGVLSWIRRSNQHNHRANLYRLNLTRIRELAETGRNELASLKAAHKVEMGHDEVEMGHGEVEKGHGTPEIGHQCTTEPRSFFGDAQFTVSAQLHETTDNRQSAAKDFKESDHPTAEVPLAADGQRRGGELTPPPVPLSPSPEPTAQCAVKKEPMTRQEYLVHQIAGIQSALAKWEADPVYRQVFADTIIPRKRAEMAKLESELAQLTAMLASAPSFA